MARPLIVEGEAVARMADLVQSAGKGTPCERRRQPALGRPWRGIGGVLRVRREDVLDIHQDQFLMLLLVIEAELEQRQRLCRRVASSRPSHRHGRGTRDLGNAGTGQEASLGPRMSRPQPRSRS